MRYPLALFGVDPVGHALRGLDTFLLLRGVGNGAFFPHGSGGPHSRRVQLPVPP